MGSTLKSLWRDEDFLDVTIACDDDQINAHKVILSAASPFFHNILKRNPHSHPLLYLKGTAKKDMLALLDFIYSGEAHVLQEDLERFMALANSLQVKGLQGDIAGSEQVEGTFNKMEGIDKELEGQDGRSVKTGLQGDTACSEQVEGTFNKMEGIDNELEGQDERSVKNEDITKEDIQNIELEEESVTKNDIDNGVQTSKLTDYKSDTPVLGMKQTNQIPEALTPNTRDTSKRSEYDKEVYALLGRTPTGTWRCIECNFESKNKGHVKEHAERHIEGYSHECNQCDSIFSTKSGLGSHKYRFGH